MKSGVWGSRSCWGECAVFKQQGGQFLNGPVTLTTPPPSVSWNRSLRAATRLGGGMVPALRWRTGRQEAGPQVEGRVAGAAGGEQGRGRLGTS